MGTGSSSPALTEEERTRKRELEKHGILVPPSFGVGVGSPSLFYFVHAEAPTTTPLESLAASTLGYRILNDYMSPGFTLSSSSSSSSLAASMLFPQHKPYDDELLRIRHAFSDTVRANLDFHSSGRVDVSSNVVLSPSFRPYFTVDVTRGAGHVGFHSDVSNLLSLTTAKPTPKPTEYYRNDPFQEDSPAEPHSSTAANLHLSAWSQFDQTTPIAANGYCALQVPGCRLAAQARLPLRTLEPTLAYHLSCNLSSPDTPPMMVDVYQRPQQTDSAATSTTTLRISQVVSMDRLVLNPLETRCPTIRNNLGWAVEMRRAAGDSKPTLAAGLACQINRGVAVKLVGGPSQPPTGALLFRRWQHPRITASVLIGQKNGAAQPYVRGVSFELELGGSTEDNGVHYEDGQGPMQHATAAAPPPTKITLPGERVS